jgi:hypothetical protein
MSKYKIDGVKFATMEELKASLWELYKDKMSEAEFDNYIKANVQELD